MTDILATIVAQKKIEVVDRKKKAPLKKLEKSENFSSSVVSLKEYITRKDKSGIIAEIKRKSPSKGILNHHVCITEITTQYIQAGASALSILTDSVFFGGNNQDLMDARKYSTCPILRKDFIIDEYQIVEAKSIGADAVLLIAAILTPAEIVMLSKFAKRLHLEVLMEVHNKEELLSNLSTEIDLIGVNNRDLKTFEVSLDVSKKLAPYIPQSIISISESGIARAESVIELKKYGYQGFLMGENFMKHPTPGQAAKEFIQTLYGLDKQHVKS